MSTVVIPDAYYQRKESNIITIFKSLDRKRFFHDKSRMCYRVNGKDSNLIPIFKMLGLLLKVSDYIVKIKPFFSDHWIFFYATFLE